MFFKLAIFLNFLQLCLANVTSIDTTQLKVDPRPGAKNFAGYIDVSEGKNSLFYWTFESRNDPATDPVVLFLNGGPGCSSLKGAMFVIGPGIVQANMTFKENPYSMNNNATIIYLDEPAGTGGSTVGKEVSTMNELSSDVIEFLNKYFEAFPRFKNLPFHITGISDAGHFVAAIAAKIVDKQETNIQLKSISIGNGLFNPLLQFQYIRQIFCDPTDSGTVNPILDEESCNNLEFYMPLCIEKLNRCRTEPDYNCTTAMMFCENTAWTQYSGNWFDISRPCHNLTDDCYSQDAYYQQYMRQPEIIKFLGLKKTNFDSCNITVRNLFYASGAQESSAETNLTKVLDANIPVLLYAGDKDSVYTYLGIEAVAKSLQWSGQKAFNQAKKQSWIFNGKPTAEVTRYKNLEYVRVLGAGHLVGWDFPAATSELFNAVLFNDMNVQNITLNTVNPLQKRQMVCRFPSPL